MLPSDLQKHNLKSGLSFIIFYVQCGRPPNEVLETVAALKANGLTLEADMLSGKICAVCCITMEVSWNALPGRGRHTATVCLLNMQNGHESLGHPNLTYL